jgi:hypothetical protein
MTSHRCHLTSKIHAPKLRPILPASLDIDMSIEYKHRVQRKPKQRTLFPQPRPLMLLMLLDVQSQHQFDRAHTILVPNQITFRRS